jgi:hypothetical protein
MTFSFIHVGWVAQKRYSVPVSYPRRSSIRNIVFQVHIACEQLITGSVTTISVQTLYIILQHVSALYGHHQAKYL